MHSRHMSDTTRDRQVTLSRRRVLQAGAGAAVLTAGAASSRSALAQATPGVTPVVERQGDPVSFSYLRPTWGPATFTKDGPYQQMLEQMGKVDIEVQIIPVIDYDTKVNTILASGDIPDVIWGSGPSRQIWKDAQDQGAFTPINDLLDAYPAVKAAVPQSIWDQLADESGAIYFVPQLIYPVVPFSLFYRQDVFEAKGLSEPTTIDEFVAVMEELTGDPAMSPFTMGYTWHAKDLATAFGFALNGWQPSESDPNLLEPWYVQEKQIDLHFWFQDLYRRQLLDQNYGVNVEPNLSDQRFEGGKSAIAAAHWSAFNKFTVSLRTIAPEASVGVLSPLGPTAGTRMVHPVDRGFYISSQMQNAEGFFDFLNWSLTDGTTFRRYGIEDKTYRVVADAAQPIPDLQREEAYRGPQIEPVSFISPIEEKLDWTLVRANYEGAGIGDEFEYVQDKFEAYSAHKFYDFRNPFVISPTEGADGTRLYEDILRPVIDSVIIDANRTRDEWAAAVQQWREAGGNQIIAEVNELQTDKSQPDYGV